MKRGEFLRTSIEEYHAADCVSHSKLETFRDPDRGPARFKGQYIDRTIPGFAGSPVTDFGASVDALLLEKRRIFVAHPTTYQGKESQKANAPLIDKPWNWNANACNDWAAAQPKGTHILSPDPLDPNSAPNVEACCAAVMANPIAAALLTVGEAQLTFRYDFGRFKVQVRPDWWNKDGVTLPDGTRLPSYLVDLKTAEDAAQFERNRRTLGYDRQAALYSEMVRMVLADIGGVGEEDIPPIPFFFIVVYKAAPVQCVVTVLEKQDLTDACEQVHDDIHRLKRCYESGQWPGVPSGIVTMPSLDWKRARNPEFTPEPAYDAA